MGWVKRRGDKDGGVDKGRSDKAFVSPGSSIPGAGCTACLMEKKRVRGKQRIFMAISKDILHVMQPLLLWMCCILDRRPAFAPPIPPQMCTSPTLTNCIYLPHLPLPSISPNASGDFSTPISQTSTVFPWRLSKPNRKRNKPFPTLFLCEKTSKNSSENQKARHRPHGQPYEKSLTES